MVEVKTIMNAPVLRKFGAAQAKRRLWLPLTVAAVLLGIGLFCLFDDKLGMAFSLPIIVIAFAVPLAYWGVTRWMIGRVLKNSDPVKNGATRIFRFCADKILINESGKNMTPRDVAVPYQSITKATECDEAFYLYAGRTDAYIVDAKGFVMGSRRELHDLLYEKLGSKKFKFSKRMYAR